MSNPAPEAKRQYDEALEEAMIHSIFCYICKRHIEVNASSPKEAMHEFNKCGHNNDKVKTLNRGLVGK